jgi:hypothetical protein
MSPIGFRYFRVAEAAKFQSGTREPASQQLRSFGVALFDDVVEDAHHDFGLVDLPGIGFSRRSDRSAAFGFLRPPI